MVNVQIDAVDKHLDKATYLYYGILSILHVLYVVAFLGIFSVNASYIHSLNVVIQTIVILFLFYRFNPLRQSIKLTDADITFVFGSAVLLATNLFSVELARWVNPIITKTKTSVSNNIPFIKKLSSST